MEIMRIAYIVLAIGAVVIAVVLSRKEEAAEIPKREITTMEMFAVVNFFAHFEHATPYEKEVLTALAEKLEEEMDREMDRG